MTKLLQQELIGVLTNLSVPTSHRQGAIDRIRVACAGHVELSGADLCNVDLSGLSLHGYDIRDSLASGMKAVGCVLPSFARCRLDDLMAVGCHARALIECDLPRSSWTRSAIDIQPAGCNFESAVLDEVSIGPDRCDCNEPNRFDKCILTFLDAPATTWDRSSFRGAVIQDAVLSRASFRGADLRGCQVARCNLVETSLDGALIDGMTGRACAISDNDQGFSPHFADSLTTTGPNIKCFEHWVKELAAVTFPYAGRWTCTSADRRRRIAVSISRDSPATAIQLHSRPMAEHALLRPYIEATIAESLKALWIDLLGWNIAWGTVSMELQRDGARNPTEIKMEVHLQSVIRALLLERSTTAP